jgi:hypothetical protein
MNPARSGRNTVLKNAGFFSLPRNASTEKQKQTKEQKKNENETFLSDRRKQRWNSYPDLLSLRP